MLIPLFWQCSVAQRLHCQQNKAAFKKQKVNATKQFCLLLKIGFQMKKLQILSPCMQV